MIYAVGDIHGYTDQLDQALARIEKDGGADARIVFLGDYTDRGPDSCGVVARLLDGVNGDRNWTVLRGNHDRMFCRFVTDGTVHDKGIKTSGLDWLHPRLGGTDTLRSYGVDTEAADLLAQAQAKIPPEHLAFLETRPLYLETEDLIFVHAGIRPGVALKDQTEDDLIWIRDGFLDHQGSHEKLIIHGHTALDTPEHFGNRIDLDGGCGYGRELVPAVFEGSDCWLLTKEGRVPLTPPAETALSLATREA